MADPKALIEGDVTSQILESDVFDVEGNEVKLGSLFDTQKTVLVFIRHFFCGRCQEYVAQLASVRKEALEKAGAKIVIVGCGEWKPIANYAELTRFHGPILADPSRKLYQTLGMIEHLVGTPAGEKKKSYLTSGLVTTILTSIWNGPVKNPSLIGKQGNISQLGGEFIFGPDNECIFAHRMQHTEDHTEVPELMSTVGVAYP